MITISLCMIVRNEEEVIGRCLSSIEGIADEIIIVDTGSTDRTKEIASKFTDQIFDFTWIDNFAAARNYSFSKATKEFILWLDSDDIIDEKSRNQFIELKNNFPAGIDRVTLPYHLVFDDAGNVKSTLRRNRIVRRSCNFQWIGPVHEYLAVWGPVLDGEVAIKHMKNKPYTDRNLKIYLAREQSGEEFTPRDLYYFGNELRDHARYKEAVNYYTRFLATEQGWVEDNIQACVKMAQCLKELGDPNAQFAALCRTLLYDTPRAQPSCDIGGFFMEKERYAEAIYWYKQAYLSDKETNNLGMVNPILNTWYPHLQICLCYDKLKMHELANEHNEKALAFHHDHPSMIYNRRYFRDVLGDRFVRGEGTPPITSESGS
ncbi:glycosyltransferase [Paenibacillus anaericanus]|uniref:Glycosyltransferase n=1 Tax=Paenibacillus anaericanus TaxID=170367 RepID=A0A433Y8J3_9BACL|nr:glycosyltransferase [Paenibacillus anaericanus]RUT46118.1 glycosyltransferase [Paenibacillus anaericanus]